MIKEIRYKNFKALRDATLPLGRFTLIVGANGTGKTTAIKGVNLLKKPQEFSWEDIKSAYAKNDDVVSLSAIIGDNQIQEIWDSQGYVIPNAEGSELLQNLAKNFSDMDKSSLTNFCIFSFDSEKISQTVRVSSEKELSADGGNLAGILDLLKDTEPERWKGLNEELERWFPEFDQILFDRNDDGKYIVLRTKLGKHKIKAKDLSDGTRLALAYLTLAYLPNPPKIVAFEEPERGIHPRLLENIQEAMYRLAYPENYGEKREPIQVIATTHSPYLLDLYKDYPEEIVIASKNENGVHFERLIDQPYYEKVIQDAPLGEVWFTGVLGGVPVQP
jgi:predicted ATPase